MKFKVKFLLLFLLLSLIPVVLITLLSLSAAEKTLTNEKLNHLENVSHLQKERVKGIIEQNYERLKLITSRTQLRVSLDNLNTHPNEMDRNKINRILFDARTSIKGFINLSVINLDGVVVGSTAGEYIGNNYKKNKIFNLGKKQNRIDQFYLDDDNLLCIYLTGPLYLNQKLIGVIIIESKADNIIALANDYIGLGKTGESLLVKHIDDHITIISPLRFNKTSSLNIMTPFSENNNPMEKLFKHNKSQMISDEVDYRGEKVLASIQTIQDVNWKIITKIDKNEALASVNYLRTILLSFIAVSIFVIATFAIFFSRSMSKPIEELTNAAMSIKDGKMITVTVNSNDEIQTLANVFNEMTSKLLSTNNELADSLKEKEVLLIEIHHRVKNNLAIILSLLSLQATYITDEKVMYLFKESISRINCMALLHKKLYRFNNFAKINLHDYINSLVEALQNFFGEKDSYIITLDIDEINLDFDTLIPCGLIINEIITNIFKHAYDKSQVNKKINLSIKKPDKTIILSISDNGKGLPLDFDISQQKGLGMRLIHSLVKQINGTITVHSDQQTVFTITFPFIS